jgi:hypothetical protein
LVWINFLLGAANNTLSSIQYHLMGSNIDLHWIFGVGADLLLSAIRFSDDIVLWGVNSFLGLSVYDT